MNILYLSRAWGENRGGMERLSYELSNELKKLPGTHVDIMVHRGSRITSPIHNLTSLLQGNMSRAGLADVILLGDPLLSFTGWFLNKIYAKPVAVIVHGLDITYHNVLYQAYLKLFFRRLQLYLPISFCVNTLLEQMGVSGTCVVVNPGIHDRLYSQDVSREQLARLLQTTNYQLRTNDIVLLTVGRLVKRKGHAWFIKNVLPQLPSIVHYLIAGTGPEYQQINKTARESNVLHRVHLLGAIPDNQLKILYNTADAFIQPNIQVEHDIEGFGLVLLEAALCRRPVLAAAIDGIPDAIHHEKNGLLLPAQDKNAWIITLNRLAAGTLTLPSDARQYTLNSFSWQKIAPRYAIALSETLTT